MPHFTKIATCNYCGTRAALVLSGEVRHELACSGCGAPLHDLKLMPARKADRKTFKPSRYERYEKAPKTSRKPPTQKHGTLAPGRGGGSDRGHLRLKPASVTRVSITFL